MSHENYRLKVTAGPSYDTSTHSPVAVNTSTSLVIKTPNATTILHTRLQSFRSTSKNPLPSTHPYFTHSNHTSDLYSFQLQFKPTSETPIPGDALVFGNDFSRPIRNHLPTGFRIFWNLAKWVDPGLEGDVYADEPWIYGCVLSSMNVIKAKGPGTPAPSEIGTAEEERVEETETEPELVEDGNEAMHEDTTALSTSTLPIPPTAAGRQKFFLNDAKKREVSFQKGYTYGFDFFGPWLDFNTFTIKLPGFTVSLLKYWDGQPVRYVLKNKASGEVYAVILLEFVEIGSEEETG